MSNTQCFHYQVVDFPSKVFDSYQDFQRCAIDKKVECINVSGFSQSFISHFNDLVVVIAGELHLIVECVGAVSNKHIDLTKFGNINEEVFFDTKYLSALQKSCLDPDTAEAIIEYFYLNWDNNRSFLMFGA